MSAHREACALISENYPETAKAVSVGQALTPNLVAHYHLELPKKVWAQAVEIVKSFHELRCNPKYISHVEHLRAADLAANKNFSALMSYDFHLTPDNTLKLIEINTNASSSLLVDLQYRRMKLENPAGLDFRKVILETFKEEFRLSGVGNISGREFKTIAIIDENPAQQKMYIEFLMYAELLRNAGFTVVVDDPSRFTVGRNHELQHQSGLVIDLVYNRHTDFYLSQAVSTAMRESYQALATCFSPNPREYALLADKERLQEISKDGFLESFGLTQTAIDSIRGCLLKTFSLHQFTREEAWAQRKKYFFKPARAFGGKAVYKGASISKGHFENLWDADTVAQEFQQAPEIMRRLEDGSEQTFKYDLRFYAYQDQVQLANARVYQGQTTNATTFGGGLAPLMFN